MLCAPVFSCVTHAEPVITVVSKLDKHNEVRNPWSYMTCTDKLIRMPATHMSLFDHLGTRD